MLRTALWTAVIFAAAPMMGQVIISEIMYNPASTEGGYGDDAPPVQTEWLELYNAGDAPADLGGHFLQDEDGRTAAIPADTTLKPGEALVLIPGDQTVSDFRAAWGRGAYQVVSLDGWGLGDDTLDNLANSPSDRNEVLTLRNAAEEVVDQVNYDDESPWPSDSPQGGSIILRPSQLSAQANDHGESWVIAREGELGAKKCQVTEDYNREDIGSPGVVVSESSE
ncbi:MAG: lamin tail domain-containing protein [Planctomycetota bacterium]